MSDKFHLSLESIDNGYVIRGPLNVVYREKPIDAINTLLVEVEALKKEIMNPQK